MSCKTARLVMTRFQKVGTRRYNDCGTMHILNYAPTSLCACTVLCRQYSTNTIRYNTTHYNAVTRQ